MSKPTCPKPERLREFLDDEEFDYNTPEVQQALEWLCTHLENRNLYHRKQNLKNKFIRQLASEVGIDIDADQLASEQVFMEVANSMPREVDHDA